MTNKDIYKLMIYFAHTTLVIYSKTIVSHRGMSVGEFQVQNAKEIKRVFDEGLSIMNYELSGNQIDTACSAYLTTKWFPSSVYKTEVFQLKNKEDDS